MRLKIEHITTYTYRKPVALHRHRLVLRPREGHDLRVEHMHLQLTPTYHVQWVRDVFGNSIALVDWLEPADTLRIVNDVVVERLAPFPACGLHEPWVVPFPPRYDPVETAVVAAYTEPSFPGDVPALKAWLDIEPVTNPLDAEGTILALCRRVFAAVRYRRRMEKGVQTPAETLAVASGSCRDMATLLMDAARIAGVAARFASGYLHGSASQAGQASMHAWAEVYLPTLGWRAFDPTIGDVTSMHHIVTGVSTHPRGVMPVSGSFSGGSADYVGLTATVTTRVLEMEAPGQGR
jgi:transglutaminase-like putative cysteine protease